MNEMHLFAGIGGGILGGMLLGHTCVCAVEIEPYCRSVLKQRQDDGMLPKFPIWDDVRTFDGTRWHGKVDVVCGGFPCTDISCIGRGEGIDGEKSGLWKEMSRIIGEVRPRYVFVENSPMLVNRGLGRVLGDLSEMGFDAQWGVIGADDAGFPHHRKRMWILGYSRVQGLQGHPRHVKEFDRQERQEKEAVRPTCQAGLRFAGWKFVVCGSDVSEDGECPLCGDGYAECGCPGPTQDGIQYGELNGFMYGREKKLFVEP